MDLLRFQYDRGNRRSPAVKLSPKIAYSVNRFMQLARPRFENDLMRNQRSRKHLGVSVKYSPYFGQA